MPEISTDLVLAQGQFALVQDGTKGNVNVMVGPYKNGMTNNDWPVLFDAIRNTFKRVQLSESIQQNLNVVEGSYVVLENPAKTTEDGKQHPQSGTSNNPTTLYTGRKTHINGPASFALWPGQIAKVIRGHHLRSNQYLLVRVYNAEEAKKSWEKGVVQGETQINASKLSIGDTYVIKGTEVSFFIPPTGVEVLDGSSGSGNNYVREAITLETLEYCILLDEEGKKRYEEGPNVVFPTATESFVTIGGNTKFRAIELNENMGLHIKVIEAYEDTLGTMADYPQGAAMPEGGEIRAVGGEGLDKDKRIVVRKYKVGEELFIRGDEQRLYFPRPEHAIIEQGDKTRHYGVVIPGGEARYVLDKTKGVISMITGPTIFLADPRKEVLVRRVLDRKTVDLWYPGNREAQDFNERLRQTLNASGSGAAADGYEAAYSASSQGTSVASYSATRSTPTFAAGDVMRRSDSFTPPRQITLDTKFEGVPRIDVWNGYAVMVVNKKGERRVEVGPTSISLAYDETLEAMELSAGVPKGSKPNKVTAYLRTTTNRVSDSMVLETQDLVKLTVVLSYRVNFEGENKKWFMVENYVKFLTDHLRSLLRSKAKRHTVAELNANAADLIRGAILGEREDGRARAGRPFDENGMRVYEVEVKSVTIDDSTISNMLAEAQRTTVQQNIALTSREHQLKATEALAKLDQGILSAKANTILHELKLLGEKNDAEHASRKKLLNAESETSLMAVEAELTRQDGLNNIVQSQLDREKKKDELHLATHMKLNELFVARMGAIQPAMITAMTTETAREFMEEIAKSVAPIAVAQQTSLDNAVQRLFGDTPIARMWSDWNKNTQLGTGN